MQPYFLPYIGYFQLINSVETFVVLDDVNFIKKGWINRNQFLVANKSFLFSIPLVKASQNRKINHTLIDSSKNWESQLLKILKENYKKAPYFQDGIALLKKVLAEKYVTISEFNFKSLKAICNYLQIETRFIDSSMKFNNSHLKGQDRIIDICTKSKCSDYINPIGGISLYDSEIFKSNNISLYFLNSAPISYPQFSADFIPNLSILDVIMFNSVDEIRLHLMPKYELIQKL